MMARRLRALGVHLVVVLCAAGVCHAAPAVLDTSGLPAATELRGPEILVHPVGKLAISYAELVHAGRMDDALALATLDEQARARNLSRQERAISEQFKRKVVPKPDLFTLAIQDGGVLSIHGATAFLEIVTTFRRAEPDGTVTSSSTSLALPFSLENGEWRLAG